MQSENKNSIVGKMDPATFARRMAQTRAIRDAERNRRAQQREETGKQPLKANLLAKQLEKLG